ncbi:MAG: hypothetical protein J6D52_00840 [Clostridia bacterium]|nr:hypothetical protein [Clostridia bacterium]
MLYSYDDCLNKYGNHYQLTKMLESEKIFKIEPGVYSDVERVSDLELIVHKYPNAVFTMNSAFYYHSLTDVIPDKYYLATSKDAYKISARNIKQFFHRDDKLLLGVTYMQQSGVNIRIYDQERMLIELVRNKTTLPFDYYKEIIENYRKRVISLDVAKLQDYISVFPRQNHIFETIQLEVF